MHGNSLALMVQGVTIGNMKPFLLAIFTALPLVTWAQVGGRGLDIPPSPIRAQSLLNGQMIVTDTEFLTPDGIIDTLPQLQQAYVPTYEELEPAAGPDATLQAQNGPGQPEYEPAAGLVADPASDLATQPTPYPSMPEEAVPQAEAEHETY